jgi:hypothetical protein
MNTLEIQSLGVTQEGAPTRWRATGYVDGLGWLEAWGTSLVTAMEALQALAAMELAREIRACRGLVPVPGDAGEPA